MKKVLTPAERLIVAADFKPTAPNGREWVKAQVLALADNLKETGVCIKVNSALRACGYELIDEIHSRGLRVFADLKLFDISETLSTDGVLLREADILTVACSVGKKSMRALKAELPDTEVLGVTVLTSFTDLESRAIFGDTVNGAGLKLAILAELASMDGIVCSPKEAKRIGMCIDGHMTINTPGIRPFWSIIDGDDQNPDLVMTPAKAIKAGADRIIVGRPILRAVSPHDATMKIIDEIAKALL